MSNLGMTVGIFFTQIVQKRQVKMQMKPKDGLEFCVNMYFKI